MIIIIMIPAAPPRLPSQVDPPAQAATLLRYIIESILYRVNESKLYIIYI